jgi:hypothetical protein
MGVTGRKEIVDGTGMAVEATSREGRLQQLSGLVCYGGSVAGSTGGRIRNRDVSFRFTPRAIGMDAITSPDRKRCCRRMRHRSCETCGVERRKGCEAAPRHTGNGSAPADDDMRWNRKSSSAGRPVTRDHGWLASEQQRDGPRTAFVNVESPYGWGPAILGDRLGAEPRLYAMPQQSRCGIGSI